MTKHRAILYGVTLREAALYLREMRRQERLGEYRRQKLYEVISRSLGGDYEADAGLLRDPEEQAAPENPLAEWIRLSDMLGCSVPEGVREKARG